MGRLVLAAFVMLFGIAGCAGGGAQGDGAKLPPVIPQAEASGPMPLPVDLPKGVSGFQKLLGSQVYKRQGGWISDYTLILQAPLIFDPEDPPSKAPSEAPPRTTSAAVPKFAYGIFVFGGIEQAMATLRIETGINQKVKFWVAFGDWDRNSWDFYPGSFFSDPTIDISDPEQFDPFIDDEGRIAVAIVVTDPAEQIQIHSLEITLLTDVSDLETNNFRWDGVELSWWAPSSTDGFRVLRRLANDMTTPWALASESVLPRFARSFRDTGASAGVEYTYLVQSGYQRQPFGQPRWYWSKGVTINGQRQVSQVPVDVGETGRHLPFLTGNKLGFFNQHELDPGRVGGIRNTRFTPGLEWEDIEAEGSNFNQIRMFISPGFSFPLLEHHNEQVNNPICTLVYSTLDGTLCQIGERQPDDALLWKSPVTVRGANTTVVALVNMPRRIGAVVYNKSNNMLELVDSADINGRIWYEFEPDVYPWMTIGHYKPDGAVGVDENGVDPMLCFRRADNGELAFLVFDYGGWIDDSPEGVACAPGPLMAESAPILALPETVVFFISPEHDELKMVARDIAGNWKPEETAVMVNIEPGSELREFALFTAGEVSYETYLVYNVDGNLYAKRSASTSFASWTPATLLDDSGTCRDLRIIKVGTDETWDSHHYASYIKDNPEGDGQLISFRDLYEATMGD